MICILFLDQAICAELVNSLIKKSNQYSYGYFTVLSKIDCNFWAMYDNNAGLAGATIHFLSKDQIVVK